MPSERCRGTLACHNPDKHRTTLIVIRKPGMDVWLTLDGGWRTTAVLTLPEAQELIGLLRTAIAAPIPP